MFSHVRLSITTSDEDIVGDSNTTNVEFAGVNELVTTLVRALVSIVDVTPTAEVTFLTFVKFIKLVKLKVEFMLAPLFHL